MLIDLAGLGFALGMMAFSLSYICRQLDIWDISSAAAQRSRKWTLRVVGIVLMSGSGTLSSYSPPPSVISPEQTFDEWLSLMDGAYYEDAWDWSAQSLQQTLSISEFTSLAEQRREPLGSVRERVRVAALELAALPDGRQGNFKLHIYRTKFASGAELEETVVAEDESNEWRILNYNLGKFDI
jgi:hypothetical protein